MRGQVMEMYKTYGMVDRQLVVPVYQRNYDWGRKQCAQLLTDLVDVIRLRRPKHFFGALVGEPESSWRWVVIDGQQRLTTVSLLMLAMSRLLEAGILTSEDPELARKIRQTYLVSDESGTEPRFRLKPVKDDAEAYQRLFGPESEFIEASNVTVNYRYFLEQAPLLDISADELWDAITRLEVMHLDLEQHDSAQRIFESLNSTGLALGEADKVRNLVLMDLPSDEQTRVYENYWNRIEKNVNFDTDVFLRWFLVTKTSRTPRKDQVYDAFKKYAANTGTHGAELLDEVRDYSDYYRQIISASTGRKSLDHRLARFNLLDQDVVLPTLMPMLADLHSGMVSELDLINSLRILESYLFRRQVARYPTNALNKIFAVLYKEVSRLRPEGTSFSSVLAYTLLRRTGTGIFPADSEFREAFATSNLYHIRPARRRYMFECLENLDSNDTRDIATAIENGDVTVEHIMPQTLSSGWRQDLGTDAQQIHETWVNRIANLTVTGYNSSYSNAQFEVKKTMRGGFNDTPYRLNADVRIAGKWGEEELEARNKRLTDDAVRYWPLPESTFEPPEPQLETEPLGTDTVFTNRTVAAFEFDDVQSTVTSWRDLTTRVLQALLFKDYERTRAFAEDHDWFRTEANFDPDERYVHKIEEGLWWSADSSTQAKVTFLRHLFDHLKLDPDELIFTLRPIEVESVALSQINQPEVEPSDVYAEITKFLPQLQELRGLDPDNERTRAVASEFRTTFETFRDGHPLDTLGTAAKMFIRDTEKMNVATPQQIIAVISAKLSEEEQLDPDALFKAISDGDLADWIRQLSTASVTTMNHN